MGRIEWQTSTFQIVERHKIPCVADLEKGFHQGSGIKRNAKIKLLLKQAVWPFWKFRTDLLVDGFVEKEIGRLIRRYFERGSVFLDIGCGDMSLRRYIPRDSWYNAIDIELSDFHLKRVLRKSRHVNVALASATKIPVETGTVSVIVSTETFEHIPEIDRAINEIYRISTHDARLICSIPNNYSYKYTRLGPHEGHVNNWTFDGFIDFMKSHNFDFVKGFMKGWWIPFPLWITETTYQLPLSSRSEFLNTNFFYVFKIRK
jgi:SAM-dependent methyltransferase